MMDRQGDCVFFNGRILSMDPAVGEPDVLVVSKGRVVAAGGRELTHKFLLARRVDLRGRTSIPGIIDAHNHLSIAALHPLWADLSNVRTTEELHGALKAQAERSCVIPRVSPAASSSSALGARRTLVQWKRIGTRTAGQSFFPHGPTNS